MNWKRSSLLGYLLPILTIIILTVLLTLTLLRLASVQQDMRTNVSANMVWVTYQAHTESLLLRDAIYQAATDPDASVDIAFRFDILLSRVHLLTQGPQMRQLEQIGMGSQLAEPMAAIIAAESWFKTADFTDLKNLRRMQQLLTPFNHLIKDTSTKAMLAQWEEVGERLDAYRNAVLTLIMLMIGIWLCSAAISIQLLLSLKQTRENEGIKLREVSLKKQLETERRVSELYRSFGSMVSHQFRTPLAIIDASMQRLIRNGSNMSVEDITHRATKVRSATLRLTNLIDSVLAADRFLDNVSAQMQRYGYTSLIHQAIAEQLAHTPDRQISFTDKTQGDIALIFCDPLLTGQILSNFLSNAVKYSEPSQPVDVVLQREGAWLVCVVRDQGRGIHTYDLPHVLQRYYRAKTAADKNGTGIGLYIASTLASMQRAEIRVSSVFGEGSEFSLKFRAA